MKRYFNTENAALRHLKTRRNAAFKRIKKDGFEIYNDNSEVYQDYIWKTRKKMFKETSIGKVLGEAINPDFNAEIYETYKSDEKKWFVKLNIEIIKDGKNILF